MTTKIAIGNKNYDALSLFIDAEISVVLNETGLPVQYW